MNKPVITDKILFLKYAIPCASTLVMRENLTQEELDKLKQEVINQESITQNLHDIFKVASVFCSLTAKDMGKDQIDLEVIREYFLNRHDKAIEERWKEKQDFDKDKCKVKVIELPENHNYKLDFCPDAKPGDKVVVHYDYIVEKYNQKTGE